MFTPHLHLCIQQIYTIDYTYVNTTFIPMFTACIQLYLDQFLHRVYNYVYYFNTYLHNSLNHAYTYAISINNYQVIWLQNIHFATTVHMPLIKQVRESCIDA